MRKQNLKYRVIYGIKCIRNGKMYVGSAEKYWNRYYCHIAALNANRHANNYLQRAWNKHGGSAFIFGVIEELQEVDDITAKEQYWMDYFNVCDKSKGYNIHPLQRTSLGYKYSDEQKKRMSLAKRESVVGKAKKYFRVDKEKQEATSQRKKPLQIYAYKTI